MEIAFPLRFAPRAAARSRSLRGEQAGALLLMAPAILFVLAFFAAPACLLLFNSVLTQSANAGIGLPLTFGHYRHLIEDRLYFHAFVVTLRISVWTSGLAMVLGYPVALAIVRGAPAVGRAVTIILVAPLLVSIVVRTYGWQLLLANGPSGVLNWLLHAMGFGPAPLHILYSETAVIIGSLHVFLPLMVLPLVSSLSRINTALEEAARTLGAPAWRVFARVTLPLSLPGLAAGLTLVFSLTAASYVTPSLLGGSSSQVLGNLLQEQVMTVYDWPLGSAIAVVMVTLTFSIHFVSMFLMQGRNRARRAASEAR
jgi:putative spermidine/putrescine transport system permease protein